MTIINLTQHTATKEQVSCGVVDVPNHLQENLKNLLTFSSVPSGSEIKERALGLRGLVQMTALALGDLEDLGVMIGGAPYLMSALEKELKTAGFTPLYAFTKRESVEVVNQDGSVTKTNVFRHAGFVQI